MPRYRTIKPEFFSSPQVVECSPSARLLFAGLWCFADDRGVHPASAMRLKLSVFPGDSFTPEEILGWVAELIKAGLLGEFVGDDDEKYWFVTGWERHQKIERPTFKFPPPPKFDDTSPNGRRAIDESSLWSGSGSGVERKQSGSRKEQKGAEADPADPDPASIFSDLSSADVRDSRRLYAWFERACRQTRAVVSRSEEDLLFVFAAAAEAIKGGRKPERLFASLVGRAQSDPKVRKSIKPESIEEARKRIRALRQELDKDKSRKEQS